MKSATVISGLLAAATLLLSAWLVRSLTQREEINRRHAANEKQLRAEISELRDRLKAAESALEEAKKTNASAQTPPSSSPVPPGFTIIPLPKPGKMQQPANAVAQRLAEVRPLIDRQYAAFIYKAKLDETQTAELKRLIAELRVVGKEVQASRQAAGVELTAGQFNDLVTNGQKPIYDEIRTLLGDDGYSQFQHYNRTLAERQQLEQMTQPIRFGDQPFTETQFDSLVDSLAASNAELSASHGGRMPLTESVDSLRVRYDGLFAKARSFLTPPQLEKLKSALDHEVAVREQREIAAGRR